MFVILVNNHNLHLLLPAVAVVVFLLSAPTANMNIKVNAIIVLLLFSVLLVLIVQAVLLARIIIFWWIISVNLIVENCLVKVARSVIQRDVLSVKESNAVAI